MFGCDEEDNNNEGSDDEDNVDDKYYYDEYDYNPFMNDNDKVVTMMMITLLKKHILG